MTQSDDTSIRPVEVVAHRVREVRGRRSLSGAQLAAKLREVGVEWDRNVVANLENGRRASVDVAELLALAYVLDVAPIHLLVPTDDERAYQVTPTTALDVDEVRDWVRGFAGLPGTGLRGFYFDVPEHELNAPEDTPRRRRHEGVVWRWLLRTVGGGVHRRDDGTAVYELTLKEGG